MSGGVRLDLDTSKVQGSHEEDVKGSNNNDVPGGYKSYKYEKSGDSQPFTLSAFLYNKKLLPGILPYPVTVTSVTTYYDESKKNLLLIDILTSGSHKYYLNPDTNAEVGDVTFTEFAPKQSLDTNELDHVLQDITKYSGFCLGRFGESHSNTATKLVGENYLLFNIGETQRSTYQFNINKDKITVTASGEFGTCHKVQHTPTFYTHFRVLGIKLENGAYMKVKGGFPNDSVAELYLYYEDNGYKNLLLVDLKLVPTDFDSSGYVPSRCYISKKIDSGDIWDIRKIGSHIDDKNGELAKVIDSIKRNKRFSPEYIENASIKNKVYDIRQGIPIDLTLTTAGTVGKTEYYDSEGANIYYMKLEEKVKIYRVFRHTNIPKFPIKSINTSKGTISGNQLPLLNTMFWKVNVYCTGESYTNAILVEALGLYDKSAGSSPRYVYYYSLDNGQWKSYLLSTTVTASKSDMENIIDHVSNNRNKIDPSKLGQSLETKLIEYPDVTLNVTIDVSNLATKYTPKDSNGTQFIVTKSHVGSNFYKFTHTVQNNARFKVKSVIHSNITLTNITTPYSITSLSAYYFGESLSYDDLILIQLDDNKYYIWQSGNNWSVYSESASNLRQTLGKENCRKRGHVINLSEKTDNSTTYKCPGCNTTDINVSGPNKESGYTWYEHRISGGGTSISGFKDEHGYQTGLPSLDGHSNIKVYWYPEQSGSPLLIYLSGLSTSWYRRQHKSSNNWDQVNENAPSNYNYSSKILKLLKKINGNKEGLSDGDIAGISVPTVLTGGGIICLGIWKGPSLLAKLIARL